MFFALLLALQTPAEIADWDGLPIPDTVGRPAAAYITCLSVPLEPALTTGKPDDEAARTILLAKVLDGCRATRDAVGEEMNAKLASAVGWTDFAVRRLKVERILGAIEERVGFTVTDRERFLDMARKVLQCSGTGQSGCDVR